MNNPYLIDTVTNKEVKVKIFKMSRNSLAGYNKRHGWNFNWLIEFQNGYNIYSIRVETKPTIVQGLIAIKADAESFAVEAKLLESAPHNFKREGNYYRGIGSLLIAIACKESVKVGYEGYVYLDAKTNLIKYYEEAFHAVQTGFGRRMYIDTDAAMFILNKYK